MKQEQLMDKRVLRTQKRLRESMLQLLEEQHYNDISVKDICEASGVSRATFYLHYKDKEDFIMTYQQEVIKSIKKRILKVQFDNKIQFFENVLNFWEQEGSIFLKLIEDKGAHMIHQDIKRNLQQNIEVGLIPFLKTQTLTHKEKYFLIIFMSNAIFGVLQDWVQRGRKEKTKEVAMIMNHILTTVFD
ncbi:TetR/AcrR family transcriptional regulator [Staphylococcus lugdunensis]|uniref:TetR/AcrR family transcriptional regulator n=1 Tax=Staphylococcus lugdunensis TaxID=28035 RepID=UPI001F4CD78C|nr:TetR/AcrR family transcriptional regulator [Staphylococcus lugdunensis]MCH8646374.1 TetR/AcrR family transcriptional regulator [Staphylococcus lugdunensis]